MMSCHAVTATRAEPSSASARRRRWKADFGMSFSQPIASARIQSWTSSSKLAPVEQTNPASARVSGPAASKDRSFTGWR